MPGNHHPSALTRHTFTGTTAAATGTVSGIGFGTSGASLKLFNSEYKDLLQRIDALMVIFQSGNGDALKAEDIAGMRNLPDGIARDSGVFTANAVASAVQSLLLAPFSISSHIGQGFLDVAAAGQGLWDSSKKSKKTKSKDASTLDGDSCANMQSLCDNLGDFADAIDAAVKKHFPERQDEVAGVSHRFVGKLSAWGVAATGLGLATTAFLILDGAGHMLREISAIGRSSKQLSQAPDEKNLFVQCDKCAKVLCSQSSNMVEKLKALEKFLEVVSNFNDEMEMAEARSVSAPPLSKASLILTIGAVPVCLRGVVQSSHAVSKVSKAMQDEELIEVNLEGQGRASSGAKSTKVTKRASALKDKDAQSCENMRELRERLGKIWDVINDAVKAEQLAGGDQSLVTGTARPVLASSAASTVLPVLMTEFVGLFVKEFLASRVSIKKDGSGSAETRQALKTEANRFGADLDDMLKAVCGLDEQLELMRDHSVSTPVPLGLIRSTITGPFASMLTAMAGIVFACKEMDLFRDDERDGIFKLNPDEAEAVEAHLKSTRDSTHASGQTLALDLDRAVVEGQDQAKEALTAQSKLEALLKKIILSRRGTSGRVFWQPPIMQPGNINHSGRISRSVMGNASGYSSATMAAIAFLFVQSGISAEVFAKALANALKDCRSACGGPDKIAAPKSSVTQTEVNPSSASNTTRLTVDKSGDRSKSVGQRLASAMELSSSRVLMMALINSGLLAQAVKEASHIEDLQADAHRLDSQQTLEQAFFDDIAARILAKLNAREEAPIPGLNEDMASQLASLSHSIIATAISGHSLFIQSLLHTTDGSKKAWMERDAHADEVLIEKPQSQSLNSSVRCLNRIQGFTIAFIEEQEKQIARERAKGSSASSHDTLRSTTGASLWLTSQVMRSVEEMIETTLSRPLTLMKQDEVAQLSQDSLVKSKDESAASGQRLKKQAKLGESASFMASIRSLSTGLTQFGVSLEEIARELSEKVAKLEMEDVSHAQGGQMHSSQRSSLLNLAQSLSLCASGIMRLCACLSLAPNTALGTIEAMQDCLIEAENSIDFRWVRPSEDCSKDSCDSETSRFTSMSTDTVSNIVTNFFKMFALSAIWGSQSSLTVLKIMEILSFAPRPDKELLHMTKMDRVPAGFSKQTKANSTFLKASVTEMSVLLSSAVDCDVRSLDKSIEQSRQSQQRKVNDMLDAINLLEDSEEGEVDKLSKKDLFTMLVDILLKKSYRLDFGEDASVLDGQAQKLVDIMNMGGFIRAAVHSTYGSLLKPGSKVAFSSIERFKKALGCNDLNQVALRFARKAAKDEIARVAQADRALKNKTTPIGLSLFAELNQAIADSDKTLSQEAKANLEVIFEEYQEAINDEYMHQIGKGVRAVISPGLQLQRLEDFEDMCEELEFGHIDAQDADRVTEITVQ